MNLTQVPIQLHLIGRVGENNNQYFQLGAALFTWHYNIRKSQFPGDRNASVKDHGVFPSDLLHVTTKKLKRYYKSWKKNQRGSLFLT